MAAIILLVPTIGNAYTIEDDFSTSLLGYWELEETSGVRYDSTAGAKDLTDNNTVLYGTGVRSNAADFESSASEYLNTSTQLGNYNNNFTYTFWVKFESLPSAGSLMHFINHQIQNGTTDLNTQIDLNNTAGTYSLRVFHNNNSCSYTWAVTTGTWYYISVVIVFNTASTGITSYINGSSVCTASSDTSRSLGAVATHDFSIGRYYDLNGNTLGRYMDGLIDEVGLWNTNLSATDITNLYNSGSGISYSATATTSSSTTATSTVDVEELKWVLELYLAIFSFLIFTYIGYRFTKMFL